MSFLLDTNAVSEWVKPKPNDGLMRWTESIDEDRVFLSVVSLAELRRGIERLQAGVRQRMLEEWLRYRLPSRFDGRILPIDAAVADACGRIVHRAEKRGRPIEAMDAFIAATAEVYQLTLVTRNVSHFAVLNDVLNPWA